MSGIQTAASSRSRRKKRPPREYWMGDVPMVPIAGRPMYSESEFHKHILSGTYILPPAAKPSRRRLKRGLEGGCIDMPPAKKKKKLKAEGRARGRKLAERVVIDLCDTEEDDAGEVLVGRTGRYGEQLNTAASKSQARSDATEEDYHMQKLTDLSASSYQKTGGVKSVMEESFSRSRYFFSDNLRECWAVKDTGHQAMLWEDNIAMLEILGKETVDELSLRIMSWMEKSAEKQQNEKMEESETRDGTFWQLWGGFFAGASRRMRVTIDMLTEIFGGG